MGGKVCVSGVGYGVSVRYVLMGKVLGGGNGSLMAQGRQGADMFHL